ncbi:flagellar motor stator protein MotA [Paraburkholderia bonniea]|uniref:flagellar motor stator protein MotA n=1 Tax=Paraburkholderia bonniea TaxID=2152891 RepID=UPI001290B162|nr:flagellar motor stator protein MotA [Paraburkholderia bonniea]WJF90783.1 flagellar motor stator protein MotA [Paraburkholderia bonniea]WJF94097.1 flagellar motor stator protein MotA [Paraburkholderia bonniea]
MQQLVGIFIVLGCVFGGYMFMGGDFSKLWQPVELLIILGAAGGAMVLGNPAHVLKELMLQLRKTTTRPAENKEFPRQLLLLMYELLQVGRDLKALDVHVEAPHESSLFRRYPLVLKEPKLMSFIVDNFRLMAMGKISAHELEGVLEQELVAIHADLEQPCSSLKKISEAMPGFGIVAAVLGVVIAMNSVNEGASAGEIAERVAAAMIGTFIGIFFCYGVLDPLCNTLKQLVKSEMSEMECVKVVLVSFAAGKPALLAIDSGRRLVQTVNKPSFVQLETWINELGAPA